VHVHAVRHTLALIMHRAGLAPADAAALLGHTVAVHLSTYVPLTEKGARAAASGLGAAIAGVV
jgi:integrase